jgi:hypothetical protein
LFIILVVVGIEVNSGNEARLVHRW